MGALTTPWARGHEDTMDADVRQAAERLRGIEGPTFHGLRGRRHISEQEYADAVTLAMAWLAEHPAGTRLAAPRGAVAEQAGEFRRAFTQEDATVFYQGDRLVMDDEILRALNASRTPAPTPPATGDDAERLPHLSAVGREVRLFDSAGEFLFGVYLTTDHAEEFCKTVNDVFARTLAPAVARQLGEARAEVERLLTALLDIFNDAHECMEGAGQPEFSNYERLAGKVAEARRGPTK